MSGPSAHSGGGEGPGGWEGPGGQEGSGGQEDSPLGRLALARSTVDRATDRRNDTGWLAAAWADPGTRVLVVQGAQALIRSDGDRLELEFVSSAQAPAGTRFLLGIDGEGVAYFGVSGALPADGHPGGDDRDPAKALQGTAGTLRSEGNGVKPMALRQVGAVLSDRDAGLMTHAVALAYWHDTHTHCPRCGTATAPAPAGHLTTCPADGTEHFPRLDPAVIMLVTDPDERCLLARNAAWPQRRMSVLAGFVEPGESAEHAVAREVFEETAIRVGRIRYLGSQPWPMPRSLMLGFQAVAAGGQRIVVDDEEIGEAHWFTRAELRASLDGGELAIAPTSSIARRLIEFWYGAELPDGPGLTLPGDVRAGLGDGDAQHDPLLGLHRRPVFVPVGMLAGDPPVVVDQGVHRLRQFDDVRGALHLHPPAEERVGKRAQPHPRVAADVADLVRGLPGADHHVTPVVDRYAHRRQLGSPVTLEGAEHRVMLAAGEVKRCLDLHGSILPHPHPHPNPPSPVIWQPVTQR